MAAIQTCALITVMMGFLASTTFNKEFFRHCIIIIHCVLILLLLESRRLLQRENRGNQRRFWVRPIFTARKTYGCYHTLVQELRLGDREWYCKFIRMAPERFEHLAWLLHVYPNRKRSFESLLDRQNAFVLLYDTLLREILSKHSRFIFALARQPYRK